ncbi:MAG TPA: hypothetical protein DHV48_10545 [Prolixibacteraceae bacterium]|nr:hypothetical protein [Prolixibacteraceae bacterium]
MAKRTFLADLDLALNQILAARLENLSAAPAHAVGRVYFNTVDKKIYYSDGSSWFDIVIGSDPRLSDARTPTTHLIISNAGLGTQHSITGGTAGHVFKVTGATTAQLAQLAHGDLADKGTNTHAQIDTFITNAPSTYAPIAKGVTGGDAHDHNGGDGAQIDHVNLANKGTNTHTQIDSHISDVAKHRVINDAGTAASDLLSAQKILQLIGDINSTITGSLVFKGSYDAATNAPLLDATPIAGIKQGWTYVVTVAGVFFSEAVQVGDMIIAKQDSPTLAAHWTIVNKNIPDIISASESAQGIIEIATQAEVTAGTDDAKAVTPLKLKTLLGTTASLTLPRKFTATVGDGTAITYAITHNLNASAVIVSLSRTATPFDQVECEVVVTSANVVTLNFNVAPTAGQYTVTIIG